MSPYLKYTIDNWDLKTHFNAMLVIVGEQKHIIVRYVNDDELRRVVPKVFVASHFNLSNETK